MSKFKSGDKVIVISAQLDTYWYADKIGEVFTLAEKTRHDWHVVENPGGVIYENDIELASEAWTDGIPQVGVVCEYSLDKINWYTCEVLFVGKNCIVANCYTDAGEIEQCMYLQQTLFRPIKTAEEIEREEVIADMRKDLEDYHSSEYTIEDYLTRKGWRKK